MFIYAVSPVHMGAGTAFGLIDSPIQRERHTGHPLFAGSGLKGAIRHHLNGSWEKSLLNRVFGPEQNPDHAGAISFSDAQLVAFPVRSIKESFVYATCPTALARARRMLAIAEPDPGWQIASARDNEARLAGAHGQRLLSDGKLILEAYEYQGQADTSVEAIAQWLSVHAMPGEPEYEYFRHKLASHLVLIPDEDFTFFVNNATVVEPHVRIDDVSGTAEGGGLFYTENLPPESLLLSLVMASGERRKNGANGKAMSDREVLSKVANGLDGNRPGINKGLVQIGGDATTGRGQVVMSLAGGAGDGQ